MEEIYNRILFNNMIFGVIIYVVGLIMALGSWFGIGDVIKIKQKGVVVREIKLNKWAKFILNRLTPLILLSAFTVNAINVTLDYTKKDYLYGEGKITSYFKNARTGIDIDIDNKYYNLPRSYRTNISPKNRDITYKFVYARRTKLILYIEAVDDNEESDNESINKGSDK